MAKPAFFPLGLMLDWFSGVVFRTDRFFFLKKEGSARDPSNHDFVRNFAYAMTILSTVRKLDLANNTRIKGFIQLDKSLPKHYYTVALRVKVYFVSQTCSDE